MPAEKTVPYERFAAVVAERKALQTELSTASKAAEAAAAVAKRAEAAEARAAEAEGRFSRYRDLTSAGITDPDVAEVAEWAYGKLPAEGRPEFGAALTAWKAEPDKAPAAMRPFLTQPAPHNGRPAAPAPAIQSRPGQPAGAAQFDATGIMRMDTATYKANRDAILKGLRPA